MKNGGVLPPGPFPAGGTEKEEIFVRPATAGDAKTAAYIEKLTLFTPWNEKDIASLTNHPHALYLVALVKDETAGICGCLYGAGEGQLINLAVLPRHRRKGVAAALMTRLTAKLESLGCHELFLEVGENNIPAISFYAKRGFAVVSRRKHHYKDEDALVLALRFSTCVPQK